MILLLGNLLFLACIFLQKFVKLSCMVKNREAPDKVLGKKLLEMITDPNINYV